MRKNLVLTSSPMPKDCGKKSFLAVRQVQNRHSLHGCSIKDPSPLERVRSPNRPSDRHDNAEKPRFCPRQNIEPHAQTTSRNHYQSNEQPYRGKKSLFPRTTVTRLIVYQLRILATPSQSRYQTGPPKNFSNPKNEFFPHHTGTLRLPPNCRGLVEKTSFFRTAINFPVRQPSLNRNRHHPNSLR